LINTSLPLEDGTPAVFISMF